VDGPSGTEVLGRAVRGAEWTPVCRAPCDEEVPLDWEYRVHGAGMKASGGFNLEAFAGQSVVVHVDPASKGWFIAGVVGMSTGGAAAVVGLFWWALDSIGCGVFGPVNTACQSQLDNTFHVFEAAAGALFVSGAVSTFTNLSTTISQDSSVAGEPVWRTAGRREALPFPAATGAPLVTVRF
jgi:hypothetical protein